MRTFFLRYVAERLMGPPTYESGGRATWVCPFCDDQTAFSVLPHRDGFKDRYRCHRCGAWGDEYDLSKLFFDRENFEVRRKRLLEWQQDFTRDSESQSPKVIVPVAGSTIARNRKDRDSENFRVDEHEFDDVADAALKDLTLWVEAMGLDLADVAGIGEVVLKICDQRDMHPMALSGRLGYVNWIAEGAKKRGFSTEQIMAFGRGEDPLVESKRKGKRKGPTPVSTPKTRFSKKGDKSPNYYPARSSQAGRKKRESP